MKLVEFVREMRRIDRDLENYKPFNVIIKKLLTENAVSGGAAYPTLDALWREAYKRAQDLEAKTELVR